MAARKSREQSDSATRSAKSGDDLLTREGAAALIADLEDRPDFTKHSLEQLAHRNQGPLYRYNVARRVVYRRADVIAWCEERRQRAEAMPLRRGKNDPALLQPAE